MAFHFQVDTGGTLQTGLLGYYNLATNSNDFSGSGINGTDTNITYASSEAQFNGTSSISFGNNFNFGTSPFSIVGWFNIANATSFRQMIGKTASDGNPDWGIRTVISTGTPSFLLFPGPDDFEGSTNLAAATYHFVVAYRDGTNLKVFVNTVLDGTPVTDNHRNVNNTHNCKIGVDDGGLFQFPNGSAAKLVGFWNKALSTQEITDLYNGGAGDPMIPSSSILKVSGVPQASISKISGVTNANISKISGVSNQ